MGRLLQWHKTNICWYDLFHLQMRSRIWFLMALGVVGYEGCENILVMYKVYQVLFRFISGLLPLQR